MQLLKTRVTIQSTTTPGVTFTIRRLNKIQRATRDSSVFEHYAAFQFALGEFARNLPTPETPDTPEMQERRKRLDYEATLVHRAHLLPVSIKAALISIEGLTVDDKPIKTAADLLEFGTPDTDALLDEVYEACELGGQVAEEKKPELGETQAETPAIAA